MNVTVYLDDVIVKHVKTIGTVRITMLKGEKGDTGYPTDEQVYDAVEDVLEDHPEWTTTVTDKSIGAIKLTDALYNQILNAYPTDVASGAIASFSDGADNVPVKSATFAITPVQDLHGYDSPWPAGGGANILPPISATSASGVTISVADDGTITLNGTASDYVYIRVNLANTIATGQTVSFSAFNSATNANVECSLRAADTTSAGLWTTLGTANTTATGATTKDATMWQVQINNGASFSNFTFKPMIVSGSTPATTFAPYSNTCPISGFTGAEITARGVNLWDEEWEVGALDVSSGGTIPVSSYARTKNFTAVAPNTTYYRGGGYLSDFRIFYYDSSKQYIRSLALASAGTFTTLENAYYIKFHKNGTTYSQVVINYPSTDTAYHASVGATHDITWSDAAGTVYGGTLQYLGGDAWRLTKTMESVDLGTLNWTSQETIQTGRFDAPSGQIGKAEGETNMLCDRYPTVTASVLPSLTVGIRGSAGGSGIVLVNAAFANYTTAQVKTAVTGTQLVYELATPVTYDLTGEELATVLGTNNVFSNTGDVTELTYRADTALYIAKKLG